MRLCTFSLVFLIQMLALASGISAGEPEFESATSPSATADVTSPRDAEHGIGFKADGAPSTAITILPAPPEPCSVTAHPTTEYIAFDKAVRTWRLDHIDQQTINREQEQVAQALAWLMQGDSTKSLQTFKALHDATADRDIKRMTRKAISQIHLNNYEWGRLTTSDPDEGELSPKQRQQQQAAFEALRRAPSQTLVFHANEVEVALRPLSEPSPFLLMPVQLNGTENWFLLDTGATMTVVSTRAAELCGIKALAAPLPAATMGGSFKTAMGFIEKLDVGGLSIHNHAAMILPDQMLPFDPKSIDGILGLSAIYQMDLEINYTTSRATIRKPARRRTRRHNLLPIRQVCVLRVRTADRSQVLLNFDTAGTSSRLDLKDMSQLGPHYQGPYTEIISVPGGKYHNRYYTVPDAQLILGDYLVHWANMIVTPLPADVVTGDLYQTSGLLGSDMFRQGGQVRIDWHNRRVDFSWDVD